MAKSSTSFKSGNQAALKHGGEAGVEALEKGRALTGPAAIVLSEVKSEYADNGAATMIQCQAERLEAVSRLYFEAFLAAIQAGDLTKADSWVQRFGWLANSSIRAWSEVAKGDKGKGKRNVIDMLKAGKNGTED